MFTPSARAAFHRLAARAHDRARRYAVHGTWNALMTPDDCVDAAEDAQSRTDNAWSATCDTQFDPNDEVPSAECYAADEATVAAEDGLHANAAAWHRRAAKTARGA